MFCFWWKLPRKMIMTKKGVLSFKWEILGGFFFLTQGKKSVSGRVGYKTPYMFFLIWFFSHCRNLHVPLRGTCYAWLSTYYLHNKCVTNEWLLSESQCDLLNVRGSVKQITVKLFNILSKNVILYYSGTRAWKCFLIKSSTDTKINGSSIQELSS